MKFSLGRLSVDVLVPVEQGINCRLRNSDERPTRTGQVHGASDIFDHDRGLHSVAGILANRERAMVGHQHRAGAMPGQGLHDAPTDGVVTDNGERAHRHRATEFVGHRRDHARNRFASRGPRCGVGGVRVHDAADVRHVPVHVRVGCGVARGGTITSRCAENDLSVEVAQDHVLGRQVGVVDTAGLDHEQVGSRHPTRNVAAGPDDEGVPDELAVEQGDVGPHAGDRDLDLRPEGAHESTGRFAGAVASAAAAALRFNAFSRCITSFSPRPK